MQRLSRGRVLADCEVVEYVAGGAQGSVYRAIDLHSQDVVALKTMPYLPEADDPDEQVRFSRFEREYKALQDLEGPNVLKVYRFKIEDGLACMVLEYFPGRDLAQLLKTRCFKIEDSAVILLPVLAALARCHAKGMVHRDVKPGNILVQMDKDVVVRARLIDFGIVHMGNPDVTALTQIGEGPLTPAYMSPEHDGGQVTDASDLFSVGAVLYHCLCGRRPFGGESAAAVKSNIKAGLLIAPREANPDLHPALERVLRRALSHQPEHRFASAIEMGSTLARYAGDSAQLEWVDVFPLEGAGFEAPPPEYLHTLQARVPRLPPVPMPELPLPPIPPVPPPLPDLPNPWTRPAFAVLLLLLVAAIGWIGFGVLGSREPNAASAQPLPAALTTPAELPGGSLVEPRPEEPAAPPPPIETALPPAPRSAPSRVHARVPRSVRTSSAGAPPSGPFVGPQDLRLRGGAPIDPNVPAQKR